MAHHKKGQCDLYRDVTIHNKYNLILVVSFELDKGSFTFYVIIQGGIVGLHVNLLTVEREEWGIKILEIT